MGGGVRTGVARSDSPSPSTLIATQSPDDGHWFEFDRRRTKVTFANYAARTSFERPLLNGVAYAQRVAHAERELFENQQGWMIKTMKREPSPVQDEYAPVIYSQETISYIEALDMMSGEVHWNQICLPADATAEERVKATAGYLGGAFDVESLVENLLHQLAGNQEIVVTVYDVTNTSEPLTMYGVHLPDGHMSLSHASMLDFGDPLRKHQMKCR
ncbi:hypothetical protein BHE74_00012585 [Ensete ventricosum]|nr:hypothetical protein GW17_00006683 [Ensete ventricosum]RWW79144.1 hypothetical protein BHE74_00012585 [Ensete ventricosum]